MNAERDRSHAELIQERADLAALQKTENQKSRELEARERSIQQDQEHLKHQKAALVKDEERHQQRMEE